MASIYLFSKFREQIRINPIYPCHPRSNFKVELERKVSVINGGYFTGEIAMNGISAGVYIVSLTTEKDKVHSKVLKF